MKSGLGLVGLICGLNTEMRGKTPEDFLDGLLDGFNDLFPTNVGGNMQTKLNGVQLRMRRYRNKPLAQSLGEINGAKLAKDFEKRLAKGIRTHFLNTKQVLTPIILKAEMVKARAREKLVHG